MQRTILIFSVCFLLSFSVNINEVKAYCGTEPDFNALEYLNQTRELRQQLANGFSKKEEEDTLFYPIQIYIGKRSNGTGGVGLNEVLEEIEKTNAFYINAGIQFYVCGDALSIESDEMFDFEAGFYDFNLFETDLAGKINLYVFNTVSISGTNVCGYTYMPGSFTGGDRIVMAKNCLNNGYVLAHEIGHFFSLFHTHGKTNFGTTDEFVNGSNCNTAGDDLCDTPADPNLQNRVNNDCVYTGNLTDDNDEMYEPDPRNIMSYARAKCRHIFTEGQYNRARASAILDRNYFCCGNPVAGFEFVQNINTFEFTNLSKYQYYSRWNFGNGSQIETDEKVFEYTYSQTGTFTVKLEVESLCGLDVFSTEVTVTEVVSVDDLKVQNEPAKFEIINLHEPPLIKANLSLDGYISYKVYDIAGRLLISQTKEYYSAGIFYIEPLNSELLKNNSVYFVKISFDDQIFIKKILR